MSKYENLSPIEIYVLLYSPRLNLCIVYNIYLTKNTDLLITTDKYLKIHFMSFTTVQTQTHVIHERILLAVI